jgi:phosphoribosylaminoimidazole carboxylase
MAAAASLLNLDVTILDVGEYGPAKQIISRSPPRGHIDGSFADAEKIYSLAKQVDVLTVEIEHVDAAVLERIEKDASLNVAVHPSSETISIIQNKYRQKEHLRSRGIPVVDYEVVASDTQSVARAVQRLGLPLMLKSQTLAYDGRGNYVLRDLNDAENAITSLGDRPLYAEKWAPFTKEVAVMVVRSASRVIFSYPAVETVHKDNICHLVFAPLRHPIPSIETEARRIAEEAVATFSGAGVFGVELFLMSDGTCLISLPDSV